MQNSAPFSAMIDALILATDADNRVPQLLRIGKRVHRMLYNELRANGLYIDSLGAQIQSYEGIPVELVDDQYAIEIIPVEKPPRCPTCGFGGVKTDAE